MNKKKMSGRQMFLAAETAMVYNEQKRRIHFAATHSIREVLKSVNTALCGLSAEGVVANRAEYGMNKVTRQKKKTLAQSLVGAFVNPFTVILSCLAMVSAITDMLFPYMELFGNKKEDFDCLTVVIILTMVFISGTLRFVQESRSGNAAERLLAMITTTCTIDRREQGDVEIPLEDAVVGDIVHLCAGDMIPADLRIVEAKDLFVSQSSLTGESEPVEKTTHVSAPAESITD